MAKPTLDQDVLTERVGRTETHTDVFSAGPAQRMQQTLDREADLADGQPLPPLWQWLYHIEELMY